MVIMITMGMEYLMILITDDDNDCIPDIIDDSPEDHDNDGIDDADDNDDDGDGIR
jgi:hypothetical protein